MTFFRLILWSTVRLLYVQRTLAPQGVTTRCVCVFNPARLDTTHTGSLNLYCMKRPPAENGLMGWRGWRCPWRTRGGRRLHRDAPLIPMNQGSHETGSWAWSLQGEEGIQPLTVDHHYKVISWQKKIGNELLMWKKSFQNRNQNETLSPFGFVFSFLSTVQKQISVWIAAVPFKLHFFAKEIICQKLDEHA